MYRIPLMITENLSDGRLSSPWGSIEKQFWQTIRLGVGSQHLLLIRLQMAEDTFIYGGWVILFR
jgi:hypothetical protein